MNYKVKYIELLFEVMYKNIRCYTSGVREQENKILNNTNKSELFIVNLSVTEKNWKNTAVSSCPFNQQPANRKIMNIRDAVHILILSPIYFRLTPPQRLELVKEYISSFTPLA